MLSVLRCGRRSVFCCGVGIVTVLASQPAMAQDDPSAQSPDEAEAEGFGLAEIVVTASKRSSNILDEPYSISAITGDSLERTGSTEYRDYLTTVPGVALVEAGLGVNNVIVRGLATVAGGSNLSGTVVTYFDETALNSGIRSIEVEPVDIERVEVLRGPQGTYYGAGSIGGTLRIIPNRPNTREASLRLSGTLGDTAGAKGLDSNIGATFNMPIQNVAALRGTVFRREEADYIRNLESGRKTGGGTVLGGRIAFLLQPTDEFEMLFQYVREETDADGARVREPFERAGNAVRRRGDEYQDSTLDLYSFSLGSDLGPVRLDAITSYYRSALDNRLDSSLFDGNVIAVAGPPALYGLESYDIYSDDHLRMKSFAQEVRLTSQNEGWLQWLLGAYYSHDKLRRSTTFVEGALIGPIVVQRRTNNAEQYAFFGEANIDLPGPWGVDLGLRYSDYSQKTTVDAENGQQSQKVWTPRFNLRFEPGDQLFYFQVSKGFRLGGFNGAPPNLPGIDIPNVEQYYTYKSDSLWNYELGTKLSLADGKVQLSGALFYSNWTDIPVYLTLAGGAYTPLANVGKATSQGVETELAWAATRDLTLSLAASYTDAKLKESAHYSRQRLPSSPREMVNIAFAYDRPLDNGWDLYASGNAQYIGPYKTTLDEEFADNVTANDLDTRYGLTTQPEVGDYVTVNFSIGVRMGAADVSLYVKNLFDSDAATMFNSFSYGGAPAESFLRPRSIGLSLKLDI